MAVAKKPHPLSPEELKVLRMSAEWTYAETARMTGKSEHTVKNLLYRARKKLKAHTNYEALDTLNRKIRANVGKESVIHVG